ncbi:MAG: hypothetical protein HC881_07110 [Leptolyngbyaceae cyanobacterium SL_7_1]|nr:hypothetical protein [Leptolyngbyaceae cyanobacterium SL_7_1]
MQPGSRVHYSSERTAHKLADILGSLIALLTLMLPIVTIAHYSSANSPLQSSYPILRSRY